LEIIKNLKQPIVTRSSGNNGMIQGMMFLMSGTMMFQLPTILETIIGKSEKKEVVVETAKTVGQLADKMAETVHVMASLMLTMMSIMGVILLIMGILN